MHNYYGPDTEVIMFDCTTKRIGDIKVGDMLMTPNGDYVTVKEKVKSKMDMYEIIPNKGTKYTVNGDFNLQMKATNQDMIFWDNSDRQRYRVRWVQNMKITEKSFPVAKYMNSGSKSNKNHSFETAKKMTYNTCKKFLAEIRKAEGYVGYGDVINIKAKDYAKMTKRMRDVYKVYTVPIESTDMEVDVDPYVLGYWLGDGTSENTGITTAEPEIVEYFKEFCQDHNLVFKKKTGKYHYDVTTGTGYGGVGRNMFRNFLKTYHLLKNKHIPVEYLLASEENRLKLLAGLIDSDGHNSNNTYDFVFKSERLADDVIFLARTLGYRAFKNQVKKTCTNGSKGRVTGTYYRFCIHGEGLEKIPSLLKRKQTHERETKKNARMSGAVVKSVGKSECYGLVFDCNDHFLLCDFTLGQNCNS